MQPVQKKALILTVLAVLLVGGLAVKTDALQGVGLNSDPAATFVQLAKCYPKKTPCQAGTLIGRRLAKSAAYFVVMEKGSLESGMEKVKHWIEQANSHHIDNTCMMKSFKRNYKLYYEIYIERSNHTCSRKQALDAYDCKGKKHRHGRKHHRGEKKHHHGHKKHHHGHKKHVSVKHIKKVHTSTIVKAIKVKLVVHKRTVSKCNKSISKYTKKASHTKSKITKAVCIAKVAHYKRVKAETKVKIIHVKINVARVQKKSTKSLHVKLHTSIKKRNQCVKTEKKVQKKTVLIVKKEIKILRVKAKAATGPKREKLFVKLTLAKKTKHTCNKHLHKVHACERKHAKHAVKHIERKIRACKSPEKKARLVAKITTKKVVLQKLIKHEIKHHKQIVSHKKKTVANLKVRISKCQAKAEKSSGKMKVHYKKKAAKLQVKLKVNLRVVKHEQKKCKKLAVKAKTVVKTVTVKSCKKNVASLKVKLVALKTKRAEAKTYHQKAVCSRKIAHIKTKVAIAKVKLLRVQIKVAKTHHKDVKVYKTKLHKAVALRTKCLSTEVKVVKKQVAHYRKKETTLRKQCHKATGSQKIVLKKKLYIAIAHKKSVVHREVKVIKTQKKVAKHEVKRIERKLFHCTSSKKRATLLKTLAKKEKVLKIAIKVETKHFKKEATIKKAAAKREQKKVAAIRVKLSHAHGKEKLHLLKKLAKCEAKVTINKKAVKKCTKKVAKAKVALRASVVVKITGKSHHGHKKSHHGHKKHHHGHKKHVSVKHIKKVHTSTIVKAIKVKLVVHKRTVSKCNKSISKYTKKASHTKSKITKAVCIAKVAHYKRVKAETKVKIIHVKINVARVQKKSTKSLHVKLHTSIKKRNQCVKTEKKVQKKTVLIVKKEIKILRVKAKAATGPKREKLFVKLTLAKKTKHTCNKHLHKVHACERKHAKHAVAHRAQDPGLQVS